MKYRTFREFVIYKEGPTTGPGQPVPGQVPGQQMVGNDPDEQILLKNPQALKAPGNSPQQNRAIDKAVKTKQVNMKIPLRPIIKGQIWQA